MTGWLTLVRRILTKYWKKSGGISEERLEDPGGGSQEDDGSGEHDEGKGPFQTQR